MEESVLVFLGHKMRGRIRLNDDFTTNMKNIISYSKDKQKTTELISYICYRGGVDTVCEPVRVPE